MFEEKIKCFGIVKDPNPCEMVETAGFIKDGRIDGFGWSVIDRLGPCDHVRLFTVGLVPEYSVEALCGVVYYDDVFSVGGDKVTQCGDSPEKHLLIEYDNNGRISFCGMHENGVRSGLGSEFTYENGIS